MKNNNDETILKEALTRAYGNGWKWPGSKGKRFIFHLYAAQLAIREFPDVRAQVLFEHDFVKSLWGDNWKRHLQNMVIADDPIKYIGDNLNAKNSTRK